MKKWIAFMLIFVLAFVFIGCKETTTSTEVKPKEILITTENSVTEIEVQNTLQLTATVKPDNAKDKTVIWSSNNTEIATVAPETGLVTGLSAGEVEIVATSKAAPTVKKSVTLTVKAPIEYKPATGVELTGRVAEFSKGSFITLTATVIPAEARQEVVFSSSDPAIASVDESTGKVTGHELGTVIITAKTLENENIFDTYQVIVVEPPTGTVPEKPTAIVIQGESNVFEGRTIGLIASVLPAGISQNIVWTSLDETVATVSYDGIVTALKAGQVWIQAASAKDTTVLQVHKVTVKLRPDLEPFPNMGGYQIKIMTAPHVPHEHDPFLDLYAGLDKQAKQAAWLEVEKQFNCDLAVVPFPDTAPWGQARINYLNEKAALGQAETDIFVSTTDWLVQLANGHSIVDTTLFYDYYGENSMAVGLKGASTYKGGLYGLPTPNIGSLNVDKGLFYNVALVESLHLESPAKLFNEGRWTYTGFSNYVKEAKGVLQEGQTVLSGKPAYFFMGMVNAAGVKVADSVTLTMNFDNVYAIEAARILRELYQTTGWGTNAWDAAVTTFNEGNSIFQAGEYWFVDTDNRWKKDLWDANGNSRYGYVPYPYPDEMSRDDTRTVGAGGACYMMAAGRQYAPGVEAKDVYRAFVQMMLWTSKNMEEDPEFDEETVMRRAAEAKLDDPESITAIVFFKRDKVVFDPLYGLIDVSTNIGTTMDTIVRDGADYLEATTKIKDAYEQKLIEIYG